MSVRTTGIEEPGRPMVVSRTWHVIGGFLSVDMLDGWVAGVGAVAERWFESASMRRVAEEGMRVREVRVEAVNESSGSDKERGLRCCRVLGSALNGALEQKIA